MLAEEFRKHVKGSFTVSEAAKCGVSRSQLAGWAMSGDVERVARAVKSGDVVVLAMRNTPDDLSKRLLDFSFGVASALDANVECPGQKVFAIAKGNALTEDEKRRLRAQGVL